MQTLHYDFRNQGWINILPLADLHIGSGQADLKIIKGLVDGALNDPVTYIVLNGDIIDACTFGSTGNPYGATMAPGAQIQTAVEILRPLADAGRILCIMDGNHEDRINRSSGISVAQNIAGQLRIDRACVETAAVIFLDVGSVSYSLYVTHGSSSTCREVSSKINKLAQLADAIDCDVYISAHSHLPAIFRNGFIRIDRDKRKAEKVDHLFVNAASALGYGGYSEAQGYPPMSNVYPMVTLDGSLRKSVVCA